MKLFNMIEPMPLAQEREIDRWITISITLLAITLTALTLYSASYLYAIYQLHTANSALYAQLNPALEQQEQTALREKIAALKQEQKTFNTLRTQRTALATLFAQLPTALPKTLRFTHVHFGAHNTLRSQLESQQSDAALACQEVLEFFASLAPVERTELEQIVCQPQSTLLDINSYLSY